MGEAADNCIHCRTLNASKGPAVRATRMQIDRSLSAVDSKKLENARNLTLFQQSVEDLHFDRGNVAGANPGRNYLSKKLY